MADPKVSVIIPVYNKEEFLEECLSSVFKQTFREMEVICIDDGSTDNSLSILKQFRAEHENMVVLEQQNRGGGGYSRNRGIHIAQGKYIVFLDADDYYPAEDIIESLYDGVSQNEVVLCGGSFSQNVNGQIIDEYSGKKQGFTFKEEQIVDYRQYQFPYGFTRFIYETDFLRRKSIYFSSHTICEDTPFFVKAMVTAGRFYSLNKVVYCYRKNMKFKSFTDGQMSDLIRGLTDVLSLSRQYGLSKLHLDIVESLHYGYFTSICRRVMKKDEEFLALLGELNREIDLNLLPFQSEKEAYLNPDDLIMLMESVEERKKSFLKILRPYEKVIIYGGGIIGQKTADFLRGIPEVEILCFAVTENKGNLKFINGIEVRQIDDILRYREEKSLVIIATMERYHQEIREKLKTLQFKNITEVTAKELMFM